MRDFWVNALLVLLLLGQLVLLTSQVEGDDSVLERATLATLAPISHWTSTTLDRVGGVGRSFRGARALRVANAELEAEVDRLRHELVRLHGVEEELERLSRISGYQGAASGEGVVADVVFVDDGSWLRTLVLYAGRIVPRRNQPVVTPEGLVGRVITPAGHYSKVQLITDSTSSASAMIERTRRKGLVQGDGEGGLELRFIPLRADVRVGDRIVTAGIDGVYPRGIPIGRVSKVAPGGGLFHVIELAPAVDFGLLDQVYVLTGDVLPADVKEELVDESG